MCLLIVLTRTSVAGEGGGVVPVVDGEAYQVVVVLEDVRMNII